MREHSPYGTMYDIHPKTGKPQKPRDSIYQSFQMKQKYREKKENLFLKSLIAIENDKAALSKLMDAVQVKQFIKKE